MESAIKAVEANIASIERQISYYQGESDKYLKYKLQEGERLEKAVADYKDLRNRLGLENAKQPESDKFHNE